MIRKIIEREEGFRPLPYLCSEGYVTIGYGTKLHNKKGLDPDEFALILTRETAYALLKGRVDYIKGRLLQGPHANTYANLSSNRKNIIISMAYQIGVSGVYKFKKMWAGLEQNNITIAFYEMLDSAWARQTPERARRHADALLWDDLSGY